MFNSKLCNPKNLALKLIIVTSTYSTRGMGAGKFLVNFGVFGSRYLAGINMACFVGELFCQGLTNVQRLTQVFRESGLLQFFC